MNAFDYFFETSKELDKDFIKGPRETISFSRLYHNSLKLAGYLNGVLGENKNILLIAPNSIFFITAYLAIIKSGNVAVPLNPEIEHKNLSFIQNLCETELLIATSQIINKHKPENISIIDNTKYDEILSGSQPVVVSKDQLNEKRLAEIIFTSGSTGEPKGVMISHKNLIANTSSIISYLNLSDSDTMLVVLPFYYCYGLSLLHTHLRVGGSIVLNNMFIMLGGVINHLKQFNCTGFAGVPSHFQILLRKSDSFKNEHFPDLKYVTQAGGKLHDVFILEFIKAFPLIKFYVMYGQTEATARLSYLPPEKLPEKVGSCGKGIPGVQLKVVNEHGTEISKGEQGEIIAYGDNIMTGYYKDEQGTNQTLRNGWLHTGDLATLDGEGYIYLTARKKEIIKVGGKRISPKEIEEVILTIPEVIDCNIVGLYDDILGETMKATVVLTESAQNEMTEDDIKRYCAESLPAFKIPQIIAFQEKITISATGKKIKKLEETNGKNKQ